PRGFRSREFLDCTGALNRNCDQSRHGLEGLLPDSAHSQNENPESAHSHANRDQAHSTLSSEHEFRARCRNFQVFFADATLISDGTIYAVTFDDVDRGVGCCKGIDEILWNRIQQFDDVFTDQKLLAEGIETLDFAAAFVGFARLAPHTFGEIAGNYCSNEKGEERHPVLGVGDRECSNWR